MCIRDRPYPVQEAEFLLSDQLFDVSPVVQGPNGERLSTVFNTVINLSLIHI